DKGLRDARPDDRIVMETFIMELVSKAASALTRRWSLLLYRAAVFFPIMPLLAERSITENVGESNSEAALRSLAVNARRMARIWCRRRDLFLRLTSVRRSV